MNANALAEALIKFQAWADEVQRISADTKTDGADELMQLLYRENRPEQLVGGLNAPILMHAAQRIRSLQEQAAKVESLEPALLNATYLEKRNTGGHYYPGIVSTEEFSPSTCDYCPCWMGRYRGQGSAPKGVDPFGDCPSNPKLRDAYELMKAAIESEPEPMEEDSEETHPMI